MQPLDNIKVLDFSTLLPGPLAGLVLAEAGAQVIKIERPGFGEDMRHYQPKWGNNSVNFALLNSGKKSIALDLKNPAEMKRLKPLICEADVLLEQFRPGVMARLGLDYQTVAQWNPKLVYCSITGYGQTGPKAQQVGHDLNYIADTGLLDLSMGPAESPTIPPALIADIGGGTYPGLVNILLALIARQRTGKGTHLDIAMADNMFMQMFWALGQGTSSGTWPTPHQGLLTGGSARYQIYQTSDKKFVAAAPIEQKFWENFCHLINLPTEFRANEDAQAVIGAVQQIIAGQPASHWQMVFEKTDCCCTIVKTLQQALKDNHFQYRGVFEHQITNQQGDKLAALPVCVVQQFRQKDRQAKKIPEAGEHNDLLTK